MATTESLARFGCGCHFLGQRVEVLGGSFALASDGRYVLTNTEKSGGQVDTAFED